MISKEEEDVALKVLNLFEGKMIGEAIPILYGCLFSMLDISKVPFDEIERALDISHKTLKLSLQERKT